MKEPGGYAEERLRLKYLCGSKVTDVSSKEEVIQRSVPKWHTY